MSHQAETLTKRPSFKEPFKCTGRSGGFRRKRNAPLNVNDELSPLTVKKIKPDDKKPAAVLVSTSRPGYAHPNPSYSAPANLKRLSPVEKKQLSDIDTETDDDSSDYRSSSSYSPRPAVTLAPMATEGAGELSAKLTTTSPSVTAIPASLLWAKKPTEDRRPPPPVTARVLEWFYGTVEAGVRIIPHALKDEFQKQQQGNYAGFIQGVGTHTLTSEELFPDHLFDEETEPSGSSLRYSNALRNHAEGIVKRAGSQQFYFEGEAAWARIVDSVLRGPVWQEGLLRPVTAGSKCIDTELLPVIVRKGERVQSASVDYVLGFHDECKEVHNFLRQYPQTQLSVFDTIRSRRPAVSWMAVEIESYAGNYFDASYKCMIHSVAVLLLWSRLCLKAREKAHLSMEGTPMTSQLGTPTTGGRAANDVDEIQKVKPKQGIYSLRDLPPVPSIVVIGHDWNLHWTYWDSPSRIIHLGPFHIGSTASMLGTLKLLAVIKELKFWAHFGTGDGDVGVWRMLKELVETGEE